MFDTRDKRESITGAEWQISAKLVRVSDDHVLEESTTALRISDSRLNDHFSDASRAVGLWLNDMVLRRARRDAAARKAARRR